MTGMFHAIVSDRLAHGVFQVGGDHVLAQVGMLESQRQESSRGRESDEGLMSARNSISSVS